MGKRANRSQIILFGKIHIGRSDAILIHHFRPTQTADSLFLPFTGQTPAGTKLGKLEIIFTDIELLDFFIQQSSGLRKKHIVFILHAKVNFVDDFQEINLKRHGRKDGTLDNHFNPGVLGNLVDRHIVTNRTPQTEKLNVVRLDKTNATEIIQLILLEGQRAKVVNLLTDFLNHLIRKPHAIISALEVILSRQVSVLVKDGLLHRQLIEVRVKQRIDNRLKFHT